MKSKWEECGKTRVCALLHNIVWKDRVRMPRPGTCRETFTELPPALEPPSVCPNKPFGNQIITREGKT